MSLSPAGDISTDIRHPNWTKDASYIDMSSMRSKALRQLLADGPAVAHTSSCTLTRLKQQAAV